MSLIGCLLGLLSADFLRIFDISKKCRNSRAMDIGNFDL